ncbi:MAG TPA: hypothetical protein VM367_17245 [Pseudonocardia sp.]|nr:hypothetical protein [Pseudonocardia sp.]
MNAGYRLVLAGPLRTLLVGVWAGGVLGLALLLEPLVWPAQRLLLPFVAAAVAVAGLLVVLPRVDALVGRLTPRRATTAYSALAQTAARVGAGELDTALPGLAQVLAEGTGADRAAVWLAVEDRLVEAAAFPPGPAGGQRDDGVAAPAGDVAENLAVLLDRPDADHVVPVLDGSVLRAALTIGKPGAAITPSDHHLMRDVANGAGLLLRSVALNAELGERVRRADELAEELIRSRRRLARAREVERRRLTTELAHATTERLATLRGELVAAGEHLGASTDRVPQVRSALVRARDDLDAVLERFRAIARGVYPAVLRDQGPAGALDELATDLARPVRVSGRPGRRLGWEIESAIYYIAAAAMQRLAAEPGGHDLRVRLRHAEGRLSVRVDDPDLPAEAIPDVRTALTGDVERLVALGGAVEIAERDAGGVSLYAWLPDRLEPLVRPDGSADVPA